MFALVTLMSLISQVSGTPYIPGGDSPAGTDCSGLASWIANTATGRPTFGDRFHTANEERALLARGFRYGTAPDALVIGWNGRHTAVTLPDGTPVSSGEGGRGVKIGGGGAYQPQFTHHMYLPMEQLNPGDQPDDPAAPTPDPEIVDVVNTDAPLPPPEAPPLPPDVPAAEPVAEPAPPDAELPPPAEPATLEMANADVPPPAPADVPI